MGCERFIGMRYRLGADGTDGEIDCIHLVYAVLKDLGISTPPLQASWYGYPTVPICRALLTWGKRIERPAYDGDVSLLMGGHAAFGVTWQGGILCISSLSERVIWCPIAVPQIRSTFRHSSRLNVS